MFSIFDILTGDSSLGNLVPTHAVTTLCYHTVTTLHYLHMVIPLSFSPQESVGQVLQVLQVVGGETPPPSYEGDDLEPQPPGESGQT